MLIGCHGDATGCVRCAGLSRAVATALLCPVTVVKTRMEYVGPAAEGAVRSGGQAGRHVAAAYHGCMVLEKHHAWRC